MNAKKIMGAVLVALLAAALFVGAGAADENYGTVFESQNIDSTKLDGNWIYNGNTVVIADGIVGPVAEAGQYTKGKDTVYITKPTASYTAIGEIGNVKYTVANGGNVYLKSALNITVVSLNKSVAVNYTLVTYPNGTVLNQTYDVNAPQFAATGKLETGTYKIQAIFNDSAFIEGVDNALLLDTVNSFTFTVIDESDATITASVDSVFAGESVKLTITGVPGTVYFINSTDITMNEKQYVPLVKVTGGYNFTMPNNGVAEFAATINADAEETADIVLKYYDDEGVQDVDDGEIEIAVSAPVITVTLDAASYFIGNDIKLSGSTSFEVTKDYYTFNITGVNFDSTKFPKQTWDKVGKNWEVVLQTYNLKDDDGKALDVGTYTIEIIKDKKVVKTVTVALKQPFISILDAPEVVVKGDKAEFIINAEAAGNGIQAYVFGTNYFEFYKNTDIKKDTKINNKFTVTIKEDVTENMSAGQYFMVFQHPMYDEYFNITADGQNIKLMPVGTTLFNVYDRQTANAAQALCDALDSQNFDDMYVKYSFFVVGEDESFTISEIPTTIAQGETLTISGVSTANAGNEVTVEMISTAFAAVPKETVGSAAFILVTTEVAEDGTWEVTLDTSDLNVDEYSLKVAVAKDGESETWKNVNINVVEAADEPVTPPTDEPGQDEPGQDEPVVPETPGFGALAALAGLGAVAVLLLRRE